MEDKIITELVNTKLWVLRPQSDFDNPNLFYINSNMKGYSSGRYRLKINKLKRKVDGYQYKVSIYWTPYNPDNLVFEGRFNSFDDLKNIIKDVNNDLLDINRIYT